MGFAIQEYNLDLEYGKIFLSSWEIPVTLIWIFMDNILIHAQTKERSQSL